MSRASERRDADHQFVPCVERVSPRTCQRCGYEGHSRYDPLINEMVWFHGSMASSTVPHPDATLVLRTGHVRHYPNARFQNATACGRQWRTELGGTKWRLGGGGQLNVCADCIHEVERNAKQAQAARSTPARGGHQA